MRNRLITDLRDRAELLHERLIAQTHNDLLRTRLTAGTQTIIAQ